ncbi:MAG TPA: ATP-binding cassette domain-containing protein, partial [Bryobacteraceae bacterium]|nr:ATP-binding cassette domain-containing protein [Bryobacteraceae bacterium]
GGTLIGRNADRYAREADLRFSMVRINEHLDGISMAGGETDEKRRIELDLGEVLAASRKLVAGLTNLTWVTAGFGWVTLVAPILVATPLYFAGKISFGGLMMAASAFTQAQSSLRWFVDNFSTIADWRATLVRVASFRKAMVGISGLPHAEETRIEHSIGESGQLVIENLEIDSPAGRDRLLESEVVVKAGERVLVLCAPGTGKTQLFRALAGLWPWGSGCIRSPGHEQILFVPRGTPYLPRGSLREVLAYPLDVSTFSEDAYAHALERGALERLQSVLNEVRRWDRELSQEQQLRLAFARIVLHAPSWVIVDDVFGSLDDEALDRVVEVMNGELRHTSLIHIGRVLQGRDPLFSRMIHLVSTQDETGGAKTASSHPPPTASGRTDGAGS